jgi:16S rRNA (cytosine1402-N4)-methyltransferase
MAAADAAAPHIPVLLQPLLAQVAPVAGAWADGTFGAGGYTRALLDAGAQHVTAIDRDPSVAALTEGWRGAYGDKITLIEAEFAHLDTYAQGLDGVVLDIGVSSMQLDQAQRGFSFMQDGPLDMRMAAEGPTAADLVNELSAEALSDILYHYGEERSARKITREILRRRDEAPITSTAHLAAMISAVMPRPKPGQSHPATRSFQALRIAVNGEFDQLAKGLQAAENALKPGGVLAVVTFHSIEDRMVKRFFQLKAGQAGGGSRYAPVVDQPDPTFRLITCRAVTADDAELDQNPRARSAKLRIGRRTDAPIFEVDPEALGAPQLPKRRERR